MGVRDRAGLDSQAYRTALDLELPRIEGHKARFVMSLGCVSLQHFSQGKFDAESGARYLDRIRLSSPECALMSHRPSANAHYYCQILASILASLIVLATSPTAKAQFSTTLNIPPDSVPAAVSSNTQLNVLPGGSIGDDFTIGASNGSISNVELNVLGGFVAQG